jgi:hypothetical protein
MGDIRCSFTWSTLSADLAVQRLAGQCGDQVSRGAVDHTSKVLLAGARPSPSMVVRAASNHHRRFPGA